MIDEADEFSGQRSDCYIVVLPSFQLLEESGQPGIAHSCYNMCNLNKYRSEILGALLCDSTGSLSHVKPLPIKDRKWLIHPHQIVFSAQIRAQAKLQISHVKPLPIKDRKWLIHPHQIVFSAQIRAQAKLQISHVKPLPIKDRKWLIHPHQIVF